jgi:hypothetical protein
VWGRLAVNAERGCQLFFGLYHPADGVGFATNPILDPLGDAGLERLGCFSQISSAKIW